jgi:hypothetical protein
LRKFHWFHECRIKYEVKLCLLNGNTLISGFCLDVDEICTLLGYYAALCVNCPGLLTLEDGTDTLSHNVGKNHMTPHNIPEEHRSKHKQFNNVMEKI